MTLFAVMLSATMLTGCGDLSAQITSPVPSANATTQTQPIEKMQNTVQSTRQNAMNEQPPEPHSIWVTMANMRCH